jgi:hypothetical protein
MLFAHKDNPIFYMQAQKANKGVWGIGYRVWWGRRFFSSPFTIPHSLSPFFPFAGKPLKEFWVAVGGVGSVVFIHYTHIYIRKKIFSRKVIEHVHPPPPTSNQNGYNLLCNSLFQRFFHWHPTGTHLHPNRL